MNLAMQTVPPGGGGEWPYDQPWNGRTLPFRGTDKDELIRKVKAFRIQNDLDPTTVEADIDNYYRGITQPILKPKNSLRERVSNWIANRLFRQNEFVETEVAETRARQVFQCPYNKPNWADECAECTRKTVADSFSVRAGRTTSVDAQLGACEIFGWDNRTAVHLTADGLKNMVQVENPPANACCKQWASKD
jgi:hypothetical protein